jgi:hypothetical protein
MCIRYDIPEMESCGKKNFVKMESLERGEWSGL